jgi:CheY-like chemotaxis protein
MSGRKRKVLLLDDDYESMAPLKELLETFYEFEVDLSAAKEILGQLRSVRYDLLCLDIMILPKSLNGDDREVENIHFAGVHWQRTGLAFLDRLRRGDFGGEGQGTAANTPIIILSAVADDSLADAGYLEDSQTRHLEKPFEVDVLIETMLQMMDQRRYDQEHTPA